MFNSFFSTSPPVDPNAPNFHPVSSRYPPNELFGPLEPKDLEWKCEGGFVSETQTYYTTTESGCHVMCQVIYSSIGVWFPTVQFTFKHWNPATKTKIWKSVNVSNFVAGPDKRSCKADKFTISYKDDQYVMNATLDTDVQIFLTFTRAPDAPGWKVGNDPEGGISFFGANKAEGYRDGYVLHRFWPLFSAKGHIVLHGKMESVEKGTGTMIHAIQGMRPDTVASAWNFAHFQGETEHGMTTVIQMELTTLRSYGLKGSNSGPIKVNVGSIVIDGKLVAVTAETTDQGVVASPSSVVSRAVHKDLVLDADTGYNRPTKVQFLWKAPSISDTAETYEASVEAPLVTENKEDKGLIEKVDFLGEVPYVVKMTVNYVAGTKPFIYQWLNPASLTVKHVKEGQETETEVQGLLYNEATFLSD